MAKIKMDPAGVVTAISEGTYTGVQAPYEFVDNALDANAVNIRIGVFENKRCVGTNISLFAVSDDGDGMNAAELELALTIGGDCNRGTNDIGQFGIGMKGAAFSLGDELTIVSKAKGGALIGSYLSRDKIQSHGTYEAAGEPNPTKDYGDIWKKYALNQEHGTVIIIESMSEKNSYATGKALVDALRDRSTLRSRYWLHLKGRKVCRVNIEVSRNSRWSRPKKLEAYDRLRLDDARSTDDNGFRMLFDQSLTLPAKYGNARCLFRISEATTDATRKVMGAQDDGLAIYYNGVLVCISKDWLGTRTVNHSWRTHIRGALIFQTKNEYNKVFTSAARKVVAHPVTGFGDYLADKYFTQLIVDSESRRRAHAQAQKALASKVSRAQEDIDYVSVILGDKRTYPHALLSYQARISKLRRSNLVDANVQGELTPAGVLEYNMDNAEISSFLSSDDPTRRRFGRALAIQDAIQRDLGSNGKDMAISDTVALFAKLMA